MDNGSTLGEPIPTGVITPTEIMPPPGNAANAPPTNEVTLDHETLANPSSSTQIMTELMFAPVVFWASLSASWFRLFDLNEGHNSPFRLS